MEVGFRKLPHCSFFFLFLWEGLTGGRWRFACSGVRMFRGFCEREIWGLGACKKGLRGFLVKSKKLPSQRTVAGRDEAAKANCDTMRSK